MTLRRYAPMRESRGTLIPDAMRRNVILRDEGCVGPRVGFPGLCAGGIELDHVRASNAMGMKSRTAEDNLVSLCGSHHRLRTLEGRKYRPLLLTYLANAEGYLSSTTKTAETDNGDSDVAPWGAPSRW